MTLLPAAHGTRPPRRPVVRGRRRDERGSPATCSAAIDRQLAEVVMYLEAARREYGIPG